MNEYRLTLRYTLIGLVGLFIFGTSSVAQERKVYTVLEAGGTLGLNEQEPIDGQVLNGYRMRLAVGRNFNDRFFLGFGLGNEVYSASRRPEELFSSRFRILPLFADLKGRLSDNFISGELFAVGSAGYAPRLGNDTFRGGLGHLGLSYGYLLSPERNGSTVNLSLLYGVQQIVLPYQAKNLQQHSLMLTVGLFIK